MQSIFEWLTSIAAQNPHISSMLMLVGILRVCITPAVKLLETFVSATPSKKDDELLEMALSSKAWNVFVEAVEWLSSIKLPKSRR